MKSRLTMGAAMAEDFDSDLYNDPDTNPDEHPEQPVGFLRQTVAPAVAMVILYASIRSLPSLLMSQTPPINGEHLLGVFLFSLVVFYLYGRYTNRQAKRKGGPTP